MKKYKAEMSYHLKKGIEAEIKQYGNNTYYVTKIRKLLDKEYGSMNEAEEYANSLGIGRTIFMGDMGLKLKEVSKW